MKVSVLDQTKCCCPPDHETANRCNYCKALIAKLHSQVVQFKLLLGEISLRNFFLNAVRFDLSKSVDISFLQYICECRPVARF